VKIMATSIAAAAKNFPVDPFGTRPAIVPPDFLLDLERPSRLAKTAGDLHRPHLHIAHSADLAAHVTFSPATAVKRRAIQSHRMIAELVQAADKAPLEASMRSPYHTLIAYERGTRSDGSTSVEGLPPAATRELTRKLVFVPAGAEYHDRHTPRTALSVIYFHFSPDMLPHPAGQTASPDAALLSPRLFFENASLWGSVGKLKEMLESPVFEDQCYFEALGTVLAHELVRAHAALPAGQPAARGGLAPWQQRAVTSYIEEHLTETIPLATLAGMARLSPYYFCRAFKQSLGVPPHRYHINCRIELAKRMLREREQSVTHIGLALGFGETSSFSAAFRKATGTTPSSFQRGAE
jgi:AraC family transcriptional regulator